jgi:hypothetical protein
MARAYAARLGCIAFVFGLAKNLLDGNRAEPTLLNAVGLLVIFSVLGWVVGGIAEDLVRQSVESNYRNSIEEHRQRLETAAGQKK